MSGLFDRKRPTCPNCGRAKLEVVDIPDTWTDYENCVYTEFTYGVCPQCDHGFQYEQKYSLEPTGYENLEECNEDE